jgi:hypothetical protein
MVRLRRVRVGRAVVSDCGGRGVFGGKGRKVTKSQKDALTWLREHSGDGCLDRHGVVLAAGELAPFMRSTWNALRDLGLVEFYFPSLEGGKGRGRIRVVAL